MSNPYGNLPSVTGEFFDVPFVYRQICDPVTTDPGRTVLDSMGMWYEMAFTAPEELIGDATAGWVDQAGEISWKIQASEDLVNWAEDEMIDADVTAIDNMDGTFTYWARRVVPLYWIAVMIDLTVGTDRYGKSITGITLFRTAVSLPNYPYAMPSQAAALQTDLRAAGYTGATVTSTSGTLVAKATNHTVDGRKLLLVTMSGTNVTAVAPNGGSTISLPSYPYAMPGSRAALQTDLQANGYPGAVVMLYGDAWQIDLLDLDATAQIRDITLAITPDDPYPYWDGFGVYQGLAPAAAVVGTFDNVRDPLGSPLQETDKAFFRVKRTSLPI